MYKKLCKRTYFSAAALALSVMLTSCGAAEASSDESSEITQRVISTTKTASYAEKVDDDDEDFEGYTTKVSETAAPLENESDLSDWDSYDENVRATMTTTAETSYGKSETLSGGEKVTTAFKADQLYPLSYGVEFESSRTYKVVSDTTYLNLRFGPSTNYNIQLRIPDGETIKGKGEAKDSYGGTWIFVTYKGTTGWVMKNLLQEK